MRIISLIGVGLLVSGCSTVGGLRTDLSARTLSTNTSEQALESGLMAAFDKTGPGGTYAFKLNPTPAQVKEFTRSGFALTDIYCDEFFRRTNLSFRKRKFARGATNDVGTVVASVLGLAEAGPKVIAGVATSFGLADSTWRNYDDSFIVSPELDTVRTLVLSAQDQFRRETLDNLPEDFPTARSAIIRYAGLCSFLGMQSLLNQSVDQQRRQLQDAAKKKDPPAGDGKTETETPSEAPPEAVAGVVPQ